MSKRKEIGQCKECEFWEFVQGAYTGLFCVNDEADKFIVIKYPIDHKRFGCIYWKEKKK